MSFPFSRRKHVDSPWKEFLDAFLQPFLEFGFPDLHDAIDWSKPVVARDKELQQIAPVSDAGVRTVDKLVDVRLLNGDSKWLLIHVEVQSQRIEKFSERMFVYYYRIRDKYDKPLVSLAVPGAFIRNLTVIVGLCHGMGDFACQNARRWRRRNKKARSEDRAECPGEESNLHVLNGHMNLNHARLPIPPPGLVDFEPLRVPVTRPFGTREREMYKCWTAQTTGRFEKSKGFVDPQPRDIVFPIFQEASATASATASARNS